MYGYDSKLLAYNNYGLCDQSFASRKILLPVNLPSIMVSRSWSRFILYALSDAVVQAEFSLQKIPVFQVLALSPILRGNDYDL
jgi:hypothetical protein